MTFYRHRQCGDCDAIEERLDEMVLAHKTIPVEEYEEADEPVLVDESNTVRGEDAILGYVDELDSFREDWYKYQSDACYCD